MVRGGGEGGGKNFEVLGMRLWKDS